MKQDDQNQATAQAIQKAKTIVSLDVKVTDLTLAVKRKEARIMALEKQVRE